MLLPGHKQNSRNTNCHRELRNCYSSGYFLTHWPEAGRVQFPTVQAI